MAQPYETVLQRWFEYVWNQGSEAAIDELMAEDAIVHGITGPDGKEIRGPAGFRPFFHHFRTAFPDIRTTIEDALKDGDRIAVRRAVIASRTRPARWGHRPTRQRASPAYVSRASRMAGSPRAATTSTFCHCVSSSACS